jgi:hypothetical protein
MTTPTRATGAATAQRPEDENLGLGANLAYGFQHVLTMYGGIIAVPLIIGEAAGLPASETGLLITACLFMGGLATLLQTLGVPFFGCRLPLVQGVSFSGVATMIAILGTGGGLPAVFGAVIVASLIGLLITPVFSRVIRFFPPLVTGCVITTIGLTLMPVAAFWAMGGNPSAPDFGSVGNISLAAMTLVIVLLLSKLGSATISRLSILLAIIIGTVIAVAMGHADFSAVSEGEVFALPSLFHFGMPTFQTAAIISMFIVIIVGFSQVRVQAYVFTFGQLGAFAHQFAADGERRTRGQGQRNHRPILALVILANQAQAVVQNGLFVLYDVLRGQATLITAYAHGTTRQCGTYAQTLSRFCLAINGMLQGARKHIVVIGHRCTARLQQFHHGQLAGHLHLLVVQTGPDVIQRGQPGEQGFVQGRGIGPCQGLVKVMMRIHQTGQQNVPGSIPALVVSLLGLLTGGYFFDDATVLHQDATGSLRI